MEINPITIYKAAKNKRHPIKFLCAKILMRLHLSTLFNIDRKFYMLKFYPSAYSRALWVEPAFRIKSEENFFRDYLKSEETMIDIGANIGTITLACANAVGIKGKIISFEPHPKIFQYLKGNIDLNNQKNIEIHNLALSNKNGFSYFSDVVSDGQNKILKNTHGIKIVTKRLDDFNLFEHPISLLKIDVEGFELFVFQGGEKTLKIINCIFFECVEHLYNNYEYSFSNLFDFLIENNFKIFKYYENTIQQIFKSSKLLPSQNLLAIKDIDNFLKRTNYVLAS